MRKYFLILLLLISAAGFSQTAPNIIYGKEVIIQTRDTSSAELTIKNSTRNVLGYFKNIGGGKGQYTLIPQVDITALPDSLLARYTKTQADARFKSISYIPDWVDITGKPANFSTTYALSNDIQDSLLNKVSRNGSYANPSWITSLDYSKLTGTVPTWNQNTTGNAATVTNGVYTTGSYADPSWITGLAWSKISGAPAFITGINSTMVTTALGYTPENAANKGIANGYADLDAGGKIPASRIDFGQTGQTFVVASQSAMLAVSWANIGALAIRTDQNKNYRLIAQPASTLANWQVLLSPDAPVQSVNGFTGNVNLLTTHISEGSNYWWTAARSRAAQSLTTSGSSGAATYDNTTGVLNIPTYTLAGLGGQPALSGTGFVKISGTTITYDNSTYLTSYTETDPTIYAWAKATTKPSYSWGEITGTVPTWNQNTTGTAVSLSAVLSSSLGGAGSVSGILKANGSGVVSAAVASDITTLISGTYLPLSGGTLTGDLTISKATAPSLFLTNTSSINYRLVVNDVGLFVIQRTGVADLVTVNSSGLLSGTSLSMSGGGSFLGDVGVGTASPSGIGRVINGYAGTGVNSNLVLEGNAGSSFLSLLSSATSGVGSTIFAKDGVRFGRATAKDATGFVEDARTSPTNGNFLIKTTTDNGTDALQVAGSVNASGVITSTANAGGDWFNVAAAGQSFAGYRITAGVGSTRQWAFRGGEFGMALTDVTAGSDRFSISTTGAATFSSSVTASSFTVSSRTTLGAAYVADNASSGNNIGIGFSSAGILSTDGNGTYSARNLGATSSRWAAINAQTGDFSSSVTATHYTGSTASYGTTATMSANITTAFCSGSGYTFTLPSASGVTGKQIKVIYKGNLTGIRLSGASISGYKLACYASVILVSNGTDWDIAGEFQNSVPCS